MFESSNVFFVTTLLIINKMLNIQHKYILSCKLDINFNMTLTIPKSLKMIMLLEN